ncbi:MAG: sigma-54 dependent transcriptional regulator [Treponema sp.]|nr:sigma-54 dependent transcriptional regulator [Treponema sp.]
MRFKVLVVDDEKNIREGLAAALEMDGYSTVCAADGEEGWKRFGKGDIDLIITDLRMPGMDGEELMRRILAEMPGLPVIILTGHGTVETAADAMLEGAWYFLSKPVDLNRLSLLVKRALENRELVLRNRAMEADLERSRLSLNMLGKSSVMRNVFDTINRVAPSKASVLVTGESGVGKELVAGAIHELSPRKDKPLIKLHCAALAAGLLESELFGHEKGAFTGAVSRRRGRFELANGGTLFLDEIGEIDQNIQIKLLRVLQEREFERVGGEETVETDVRIIAATNKNLMEEIEKGAFREDLYFRLNVVNINVPPLRDRKDDIPVLAAGFLREVAAENGKNIEGIHEKVYSRLYAYDWPGNIRELRNCIESAVVMCRSNIITEDDLSPALRSSGDESWVRIPLDLSLEEAEKRIIRAAVNFHQGNKSRAAETLGIGRKTLHRRLGEADDA